MMTMKWQNNTDKKRPQLIKIMNIISQDDDDDDGGGEEGVFRVIFFTNLLVGLLFYVSSYLMHLSQINCNRPILSRL